MEHIKLVLNIEVDASLFCILEQREGYKRKVMVDCVETIEKALSKVNKEYGIRFGITYIPEPVNMRLKGSR